MIFVHYIKCRPIFKPELFIRIADHNSSIKKYIYTYRQFLPYGRAWFLEEESEPRNKVIFLAGENHRADVSECFRLLRGRKDEPSCQERTGNRKAVKRGLSRPS
jgi:hypothetical protein